jgi:antirestriction protein
MNNKILKLAQEFTEENGLDEEINQAYINNVGAEYAKAEDVEEAYQGQYSSDEDFVMQLLDELGSIPQDLPSYIHIDWEATADEVMMDYFEMDGYYFRNL